MSEKHGVGVDELPILGELRTWLNDRYATQTRHQNRTRSMRAPRWRAFALAGVLVMAGAAGALAASGLLTGSPVRPSGPLSPTVGDGIPWRGGSRLLPFRVADPAGGPPWGLRIVHTTRRYICLQVGRVHDGELGELGIDGAFNDDGRFHPLPADVLPPAGIAIPSSCVVPGQTFSTTRINYDRNATPPNGKPVPAADQRVIAFGLLGPHALSVTYESGNRQRTTAVEPGNGTFLVVKRSTNPAVGPAETGSHGSNGLRPSPNGALTAITYRFGTTVCSDSGNLHAARACPHPKIDSRQTQELNLHRPLHVILEIRNDLIYRARLSFTAPYAVTSANESYELEMSLPPGCHGAGGVELGSAVDRNVARGATISVNVPYPFANSCTGSQAISIVFSDSRSHASIRIGSITIHEPTGTRSAQPPTVRPNHTK
jgi:hypothetical protein